MPSRWILRLQVASAAVMVAASGTLPEYRVLPVPEESTSLLAGGAEPWAAAEVVAWGSAPYTTTFRGLRGPDALWLRFDVADVDPWHTLEERDAPIWEEEVVEIFIDPDGDGRDYAELEISPAGVVTDLLVHRGAPDPEADVEWDLAGLETRVVRGDDGDWSATARIPWRAFAALPATDVALPPRTGDRWRFNLFRIKRPGGPEAPADGAVFAAWSPVPGASFHVPEVFGWMEMASR